MKTKQKEQLLTPPQLRFVQAIIAGKSQADAYRAARFPKGSKPKPVTEEWASRAGGEMKKNALVLQALARAQATVIDASAITVQSLVEDLQESRRIALSCEPMQVSASVAATVAIAKLLGLQVDRAQLDIVHHRPGFSSKALELSEDEWMRQFALPSPAKGTDGNDR